MDSRVFTCNNMKIGFTLLLPLTPSVGLLRLDDGFSLRPWYGRAGQGRAPQPSCIYRGFRTASIDDVLSQQGWILCGEAIYPPTPSRERRGRRGVAAIIPHHGGTMIAGMYGWYVLCMDGSLCMYLL